MRFLRSLIPLACLALTAVRLPAQGAAAPQTVLDYYDLLTSEEMPSLEGGAKSRRARLKRQDVANGFLSVEKDEGEAQVALFRKKDRTAVIGVAEMSCAPVCEGFVKFLQWRDGKWQDVTDALLPKVTDEEILAAYNRAKTTGDEAHTLQDPPHVYWDLPRKGTTVQMLSGDTGPVGGKPLLKFTWDGARFTRQAK